MTTHNDLTRTLFAVLALSICTVIIGCGGGDDSSPTRETDGENYSTPPNRPTFAPPVITADLNKMASDFGSAFQVQADTLNEMADGKTLNAQQSTAYFKAQENGAKFSIAISDMLEKNPRWTRAMTEALEKNGKTGVIAFFQAEEAFKKAKQSGKAGTNPAKCPPDIAKFVAGKQLIIFRVHGMMPYSKSEMETPVGKSGGTSNSK